MKRHKFKFPEYLKISTKSRELSHISKLFLLKQDLFVHPSLSFSIKNDLSFSYLPKSKINTYCLVTGRIRYTIKHSKTSRQLFFEFTNSGLLPGFFLSS